MTRLTLAAAASLLLVGCREDPAMNPASGTPIPWTHAFDLDGDQVNDIVEIEFTGGAHCCYRLAVRLTSTGELVRLPFQLDGGYVGGLDLSRPDRFAIVRSDGQLPELQMEIETYNGQPQPLPDEWKRLYGISTHRIAVGFPGGRLQVRDVEQK